MNDSRPPEARQTRRFWRKLGPLARRLGRGALGNALTLYYAVQNPETPAWARRVIYGALAYFMLPLDAIPDLAPLIGYTDDISVMAAALAAVSSHITPEVRARAADRLTQWLDGDASHRYQDA